jgi:hypothetical protein
MLFCIKAKNAGPKLKKSDSKTPHMIPITNSIYNLFNLQRYELFMIWQKKRGQMKEIYSQSKIFFASLKKVRIFANSIGVRI